MSQLTWLTGANSRQSKVNVNVLHLSLYRYLAKENQQFLDQQFLVQQSLIVSSLSLFPFSKVVRPGGSTRQWVKKTHHIQMIKTPPSSPPPAFSVSSLPVKMVSRLANTYTLSLSLSRFCQVQCSGPFLM